MWQYDHFHIPLNKEEACLKKIFLDYPQLHFDQPKTIPQIKADCSESEFLKNTINIHSVKNEIFTEIDFPIIQNIIVRKETRYCPAFFHSHSYFEVLCVLNGQCENFFDSQTLHMSAGDICIVSPQTYHAIGLFKDDCLLYSLQIRSTTFEQTFLNSIPEKNLLYNFFSLALHAENPETFLLFKTQKDSALLTLLEEIICEASEKQSYYKSLLNSLLCNFFIKLLRRHEKDILISNPSGRANDSNIMFILRYLTEHFNHITLKELSDFFNYSERQMSRILKDYTGYSFMQLLQNYKIQKAGELLKDTNISVSDVAIQVGYTNMNHFYHLFKEQYGVTPAQYKKQYIP